MPSLGLREVQRCGRTIGTGMKSVGEVMGIGRTFEEAYQKAIRMLDLDFEGATSEKVFANGETVAEMMLKYLYRPTPKRMFALAMAIRNNYSVEEIANIT